MPGLIAFTTMERHRPAAPRDTSVSIVGNGSRPRVRQRQYQFRQLPQQQQQQQHLLQVPKGATATLHIDSTESREQLQQAALLRSLTATGRSNATDKNKESPERRRLIPEADSNDSRGDSGNVGQKGNGTASALAAAAAAARKEAKPQGTSLPVPATTDGKRLISDTHSKEGLQLTSKFEVPPEVLAMRRKAQSQEDKNSNGNGKATSVLCIFYWLLVVFIFTLISFTIWLSVRLTHKHYETMRRREYKGCENLERAKLYTIANNCSVLG